LNIELISVCKHGSQIVGAAGVMVHSVFVWIDGLREKWLCLEELKTGVVLSEDIEFIIPLVEKSLRTRFDKVIELVDGNPDVVTIENGEVSWTEASPQVRSFLQKIWSES
jgi:hypothetical protein